MATNLDENGSTWPPAGGFPGRKRKKSISERVVEAAESALADHSYVSCVDVLCGMGLLAPSNVDSWRKGHLDFLGQMIQGSPDKISSSLALFRQWAHEKGLTPSETRYTRRTRDATIDLRFTESGDSEIEKSYRTHFVSPALPERKRQQLQAKLDEPPRPVVFQNLRGSECSECGAEIEEDSFLFMEAGQPLCLPCARLDELEFLPSGDTALTRRATKYSAKSAVVVRFSRSRKRYERQGILVEPAALEKAEQECTEDAAERAAARVKGAERRRAEDCMLAVQMAQQIRTLFPGCPITEAVAIAEHTARRGSGRVGRTAAGRKLQEQALTLAVIAAIRHNHTNYDELLANGVDRATARQAVADRVEAVLDKWRK
jgi:hypothetical protein